MFRTRCQQKMLHVAERCSLKLLCSIKLLNWVVKIFESCLFFGWFWKKKNFIRKKGFVILPEIGRILMALCVWTISIRGKVMERFNIINCGCNLYWYYKRIGMQAHFFKICDEVTIVWQFFGIWKNCRLWKMLCLVSRHCFSLQLEENLSKVPNKFSKLHLYYELQEIGY